MFKINKDEKMNRFFLRSKETFTVINRNAERQKLRKTEY